MKRPQHMTMAELNALPIVSERDLLAHVSTPIYASHGDVYGGAFEDDRGCAWGTVLQVCGWVRYPLRSPVSRHSKINVPAIKAMFASRTALSRLPA